MNHNSKYTVTQRTNQNPKQKHTAGVKRGKMQYWYWYPS